MFVLNEPFILRDLRSLWELRSLTQDGLQSKQLLELDSTIYNLKKKRKAAHGSSHLESSTQEGKVRGLQ